MAALALALFGLLPRALPAAWALVGGVAFIAFLGVGLKLPAWVLDLSPTTHIGNPPLGNVELMPLANLAATAISLGAAGAIGFRGRRVPQAQV